MPTLNLEKLLAPGTGGSYDEPLIRTESVYGEARDALEARETPADRFREVVRWGTAVLAIGKDLETAMKLLEAATYLDGFPGLRDGLALTAGLIEKYWTGGDGGDGTSEDGATNLQPPLDLEDPGEPPDAIARMSRLAALTTLERTGRAIYAAPLAESRTGGEITLRLAMAAEGWLTLTEGEAPSPDTIRSSLKMAAAENPAAMAETLAAVRESRELVRRLGVLIAEHAGTAPDLSVLDNWIKPAEAFLAPYGEAGGTAADAAESTATTNASAPIQAAGRTGGGIKSRADVVTSINDLVEWFDRHDPSSPVRELLMYSARLVNLHFFEWQEELGGDSDLMEKLRKLRYPEAAENEEA